MAQRIHILCAFTYIYHKNKPNVGKYAIDPMGIINLHSLFSAISLVSNPFHPLQAAPLPVVF